MIMTTKKLILLRIYNLTFGKIPFFSKLLKKFLIIFLIKNKKKKYIASSHFFNWKELK